MATSRPPTQLAIYSEGRTALVRRGDGELGLPELPGWDGEPWTYRRSLDAQAGTGPLLRTAVTHLAPLHFGGKGTPAVALAEARGPVSGADAWWQPGDDPPGGMPPQAQPGLTASLTRRFAGSTWPVFCLPGATDLLRDLLDREPALAGRAAISPGDLEAPGELEQVQGWPLSSVWRNSELVLKLTNPAWPGEAAVTRQLSRLAPARVPEVFSAGSVPSEPDATPYFVQRRVVEPPDFEEGPADAHLERSLSVLRAMAEIQHACEGREEELISAGATDRTPRRTARELYDLWKAIDEQLTEEERAKVPTLDTLAREVLRRLERAPAVVVHGDLHLGNVMSDDDGAPQVIDWTDAALAWPGVDAYIMLARLKPTDEEREEVIGAYVSALGEEHESGVRLGLEVAPLYHALSYLRIRKFFPHELLGPFGTEVVRLVRTQMEVFGL